MSDLDRLRAEYARRDRAARNRETYSPLNPANQFLTQQRQRHTLDLLQQAGLSLAGKRILEVGCGRGGALLEFLAMGATPDNLCGVDLLFYRLASAQAPLPRFALVCADGQGLPYPSASFDIAFQYMAFSSVLDDSVKANIAKEMIRVVRRPGGIILWYDFWWNPTNRQTRGIGLAEIRRLFPYCDLTARKITLAPPLARQIAPLSRALCGLLEKLRLFNSHYLVAIRPAG